VANPEPDDFEPDGTWFSMVAHGDAMYAIEPNHGELDKITASGEISRVADISASEGHIVPTSIVFHNGDYYFGNLSTFPIVPGGSNVYKLDPRTGVITVFASGFSTVEGIDFDLHGNLYVLESMTAPGFPTPAEAGTGTIVRVNRSGGVDTVLTGLSFPTAMIFGPDGKLYISNLGFGAPPGVGQILKVDIQ
jgi:sugar lactone lactonase YvrE